MEGQINKTGTLSIYRNILKAMFCPFQTSDNSGQKCGDNCPLFEENNFGNSHTVELRCSQQPVIINIKKDEREY